MSNSREIVTIEAGVGNRTVTEIFYNICNSNTENGSIYQIIKVLTSNSCLFHVSPDRRHFPVTRNRLNNRKQDQDAAADPDLPNTTKSDLPLRPLLNIALTIYEITAKNPTLIFFIINLCRGLKKRSAAMSRPEQPKPESVTA
ncbi:MAG: hypothetical protein GXP57_01380 [Deltaproteobacteria bacterium]|nr:hypothetical protein [Deltaproteobacteria bacterium]